MNLDQQGDFYPNDGSCWQSSLKNPGERLATSFHLSKLTDLTITFPGHNDTIKAHRFVLAISSPVFERMFYGPLAEGEELKLPEDPPDAFKWLLQYIYYGSSNLPNVSLAVKVYHLAKKYQMDSLATLCSTFLQTNLQARNLPLILDTAMLHEDYILKEKCSKIISRSADEVFNSSYLGQINRISMRHLLQHHFTVKSEVTVFKGLVYWGKSQFDSDVREPDGPSLRKEIEEFLPLIRFLTLNLDDFVKYVMPTGIITPEECNSILMNIKYIPDVPVPPICSKKRKLRKKCIASRKKSRYNSRTNCLLSSPHSSPPTSPQSEASYSTATTPNSSPIRSLPASPTPSRHSIFSSRSSPNSSPSSPSQASNRSLSRSPSPDYLSTGEES